jgi:hypothetical protein
MAKNQNKDLSVSMQIRAIELLKSSVNTPASANAPIINFTFNINIECNADPTNKLIFTIVHVEIKNDDHSHLLGSMSVSCIYEITNFDEIIRVESNGNVNVPDRLIETLNIISLSTTRGVMFSTFKGTFLHGAVLPLLDPKQLNAQMVKNKQR